MNTLTELGFWQFWLWWIALGIVVAWLWVWTGDETEARYKLWHDIRLKWWLFHWFTGGELDTDRSMPRDKSEPLDAYLVRRTALGAARASLPAALLGALYLTSYPQAAVLELAVAGYGGALALGLSTWLLAVGACRYALSRWWAWPLYYALLAYIGWDENVKPRQVLLFDRVYELGMALTILCHPSVKMAGQAGETNLATIDDAVKRKLGRDIQRREDWVSQSSELRYCQPSTIPEKVPARSVIGLIEKAPESKILLGIDPNDDPLYLDFDSDSPHFLISAGTGGGKTSAQRNVAIQALRKGHQVYIFDPKRLSHIWARGRANTIIVSEPGEMHSMLLELEWLLEQRKAETDGFTYRDTMPTWQRHVVILEELSVAIADLRAWWQSPAGGSHKGEPPSVAALRKILNQGRFLKVNVVAGANRFDANLTGGGAARDQYAWIGLAEHSSHVVEMVAKGAPVQPKTPEDRRGRMQIVRGLEVTEIRTVWWEDNEKDPTPAKAAEQEAWIAWLDKAHPPTDEVTEPEGDGLHSPDSNTNPVEDEDLTSPTNRGQTAGLRPPFSGQGSRRANGGPPPLGPPGRPRLAEVVKSSTRGNGDSDLPATTPDDGLVTLREAVERGAQVGQRNPLKALREASRKPGFPDPKEYGTGQDGHRYSMDEITDYLAQRPRAVSNRQEYRPQIYAIVAGGRKAIRPGGEVKIGYSEWVPRRVRQLAARPEWLVKVFDVEPPQPKAELPDKAWHRRFHRQSADPSDPMCEVFILDEELIAWLNDPEDITP